MGRGWKREVKGKRGKEHTIFEISQQMVRAVGQRKQNKFS